MRISKMVLNLSVLAIVAGFASSASATLTAKESCNKSVKGMMKYNSNPKPTLASASPKKSESGTKKSNSQRNKGTNG